VSAHGLSDRFDKLSHFALDGKIKIDLQLFLSIPNQLSLEHLQQPLEIANIYLTSQFSSQR
jgi:hypothetical protein